MAEFTLCNNCKKEVKYISTRRKGTVKCDNIPIMAYQESGREVEVYLLHECDNDRSSNETHKEETQKRRLWVGPDNNSGRDSNGSQ